MLAHHDHLGMKDNDTIFHGALDNASGVAKVLVIAEAMGALIKQGRCCNRNIRFLTVTAEEAVLLGSQFYVQSLPQNHDIVAAVNFDGMNIWGKTNDAVGIGSDRSTLGQLLERTAAAEGQTVALDPEPNRALFFRSDQFSFARGGIPAIKLTHGSDYIGKPANYTADVVGKYTRELYHQVGDSFDYIKSQPDPESGALQEIRVAFRTLYALAQDKSVPSYYEGSDIDLIAAP